MVEQEEQTEQISKYNEAGMQLLRLHDYWVKAEVYANSGKLDKWKFQLDSIWRELYADVKKKKKDTWIKDNDEIKTKIANCKTQSELYNLLNKRHELLKHIQDSVGKGGVYSEAGDEGYI